ncbi:TPA: hypothetical protein N0F65_007152 [Lagenidium giganteum]|uniref:Uncharacterized protein n=1 Tax=Lagenidium giganteum TaxID=4803 RepID=A0AAV2YTW5_9STRA|nr:TPA: hypothetical protein N0F65_007152 [Lagenidium giganteum]
MSTTTLLAAWVSTVLAAQIGPTDLTGDTQVLTRFSPVYGADYEPKSEYDGVGFQMLKEVPTGDDISRLAAELNVDELETRLDKLPASSSLELSPWPGSYWPTARDGINVRWNGAELSPAEKYAIAFGLDINTFLEGISKKNGVLSKSGNKACTTDEDCKSVGEGVACGIRQGEPSGRCIPLWFGICHAWAPAALLEPEPKCPVTINNVTFDRVDIKALITQTYDGAELPMFFGGNRYHGPSQIAMEDGRPSDPKYRDLNPGFLHIAMANMLGIHKRGFIIDKSADNEVWNQPVRRYNVLQKAPITSEQAGALLNKPKYPYNDHAAQLVHVKTQFDWIKEAFEDVAYVETGKVDNEMEGEEYEYILELDDAGKIVGGEWINAAITKHPDFLWFPTKRPAQDLVTDVNLSIANVRQLLLKSLASTC